MSRRLIRSDTFYRRCGGPRVALISQRSVRRRPREERHASCIMHACAAHFVVLVLVLVVLVLVVLVLGCWLGWDTNLEINKTEFLSHPTSSFTPCSYPAWTLLSTSKPQERPCIQPRSNSFECDPISSLWQNKTPNSRRQHIRVD